MADWHPEQVKAAIRLRGVTLTQLALSSGYAESAVRKALRRPWPAIEAIIAEFIGVPARQIWPSRYLRSGEPRSKRGKGRRHHVRRHRQKAEAA